MSIMYDAATINSKIKNKTKQDDEKSCQLLMYFYTMVKSMHTSRSKKTFHTTTSYTLIATIYTFQEIKPLRSSTLHRVT